MKTSLFVPLLIVAAAIGFGLGWIVRPSGAGEGGAANGVRGSKGMSIGEARSSGRAGSVLGRASRSPEEEFMERYAKSGRVSSEDMRNAIEEMKKINDPLLRRKVFAALLDQLTPENAKDAFLALQEGRRGGFGRGFGGDEESRLLANAWGRIDGPGAIKALTEIQKEREAERGGDGRGRGGDRGGFGDRGAMDLISVLSGWATVDGIAASSYVNGIENEDEQRRAAFGVLQGMLVNGVDGAMNFVTALPDTEEGNRAGALYTAMIASEVLEGGVDAGKEWADSISDPDLRAGALARVAEEVIREDLADAAEWISSYADEESASRAVSRVASEWAEEDPMAVLEWAAELPDATRRFAYSEALDEWTERDAVAAGEYLVNMQPGEAKDSAVSGFATELARDEPVTALQWAETIGDSELRDRTVVDVARSWYRTDRTAATEWLQTSGLPQESVQTITRTGDDRGDFFRGRGGPGGGRGR